MSKKPFTFRALLLVCFITSLTASAQEPDFGKWLYARDEFSNGSSTGLIVHNGYPRGGATYTDATGKTYSYVIFWTRLYNAGDVPVKLDIGFPSELVKIFPTPEQHIRLFLRPDSMTPDKVYEFDYGFTDLKTFLDAAIRQPVTLNRTLLPGQSCMLHIPVLFSNVRGSARAAMVLKGREVFLKFSVSPDVDSAMIPCGTAVFRK